MLNIILLNLIWINFCLNLRYRSLCIIHNLNLLTVWYIAICFITNFKASKAVLALLLYVSAFVERLLKSNIDMCILYSIWIYIWHIHENKWHIIYIYRNFIKYVVFTMIVLTNFQQWVVWLCYCIFTSIQWIQLFIGMPLIHCLFSLNDMIINWNSIHTKQRKLYRATPDMTIIFPEARFFGRVVNLIISIKGFSQRYLVSCVAIQTEIQYRWFGTRLWDSPGLGNGYT